MNDVAGAMKTERMDDGRSGIQFGKPTTAQPTSPSMPSPLTPVDGASFYPTATDVDGKSLVLSPRYAADGKAVVFNPVKPDQAPYPQFQLQVPPPAATQPTSLLADLDDIDVLQCQWDMKHFEPGKLTESDLTCLDTPASAAPVTGVTATSVFTAYSNAPPLMMSAPPAEPAASFPVFYHPYYQQQQQQMYTPEFTLDYSTPEVKELLCTGWLESNLLN